LVKQINIVLLFICFHAISQTVVYYDKGKWGIKENDTFIVPAVYDTVFNFDKTNKVCLACNKTKPVSNNKFIRVGTPVYNCIYLNRDLERLILKNALYDTIGIFSLGKNTVSQYQNDTDYIIASYKDKKYLVRKNFFQITRNDYNDIIPSENAGFFIVELLNEGNQIIRGLIDINEKEIVPLNYSNVKLNTRDSLIIACSAGLGLQREDVVFSYEGKKLQSYKRHVDIATHSYVIHKLWEPKEVYIIYNIHTKEEKTVFSDEMQLYSQNELLMRNNDHWFIYDLITGKKKAYDHKNNKKHYNEKN
jgi:hypothetical protein